MSESAVARAYAEIDRLKTEMAQTAGKMVHVHLLDQANERALLLERELAQIKQGWAEDDARLLRAEEGWAEASERLAQVKADLAAMHRSRDQLEDDCDEYEAERDTAIGHLQAVLEWSNTERFAGRTRHEDDAPSLARAFLLSMQDGSNP
jgi:chromosome segregation ATPase